MAKPNKVDLSTYVLAWGKKHKGERIQTIRAGYLMWMIREKAGPWEIAQLELDRRDIVLPKVDLSGHAIDRASQHLLPLWEKYRKKEPAPYQGLRSWLAQITDKAWGDGTNADEDGCIEMAGIKFVFEATGQWPVLKTVQRVKRKEKG